MMDGGQNYMIFTEFTDGTFGDNRDFKDFRDNGDGNFQFSIFNFQLNFNF